MPIRLPKGLSNDRSRVLSLQTAVPGKNGPIPDEGGQLHYHGTGSVGLIAATNIDLVLCERC